MNTIRQAAYTQFVDCFGYHTEMYFEQWLEQQKQAGKYWSA